jgi:phospholipid/cholesterol/gamma-HCH transport system substrate-binding protein
MTDKIKNILIGLFVSAVTLVIAMILFLDPQIGDGKKEIKVRFANIAGIIPGTRVSFAGKPVGEVAAIQEIRDARELAVDDSSRVYFYLLTLKIDSSVNVYSFDEIAMRTTGLMGEKSVAILPKLAPEGKVASLVTDQILTANSVDPLENTFNQVAKMSNKMEKSLAHLDTWFEQNEQGLSQSIQNFQAFLDQGASVLASVQDSQLIPSMRESTALLNENLSLVKSGLDQDQVIHKFANLTDSMQDAVNAFNTDGTMALRNLYEVSSDLAGGVGTLGRLITGEDFYLRLSSLLGKGETLMNDINHYGLLFQYDKQWQRARTRKANQLKSLENPREFKGYFEGEVDSIQTSLGRLTELMEHAGHEKQKIVDSEHFKQQFGALMRSVQALSDSLKLYNEGMIADQR